MDLRLGCRENIGQEWIYYLKDGTSMPKDEWVQIIRQQIISNHHEAIFEKIKSTVNLWNKHDTTEEVALHVYASKYCSNVEYTKSNKVKITIVQDEMGCSQLSFY